MYPLPIPFNIAGVLFLCNLFINHHPACVHFLYFHIEDMCIDESKKKVPMQLRPSCIIIYIWNVHKILMYDGLSNIVTSLSEWAIEIYLSLALSKIHRLRIECLSTSGHLHQNTTLTILTRQ